MRAIKFDDMSERVYYNSALSWKKHNTGDNRILVGNTVGTPFEKSDFVSPTSIKAVAFTSSNMKSYLFSFKQPFIIFRYILA